MLDVGLEDYYVIYYLYYISKKAKFFIIIVALSKNFPDNLIYGMEIRYKLVNYIG
jgi:hypothetical protein